MTQSQASQEMASEVEGEVGRVARKKPLRAIVITRSGPVQLAPLARLVAGLRECPVAQAARRIENAGGIILRDAFAQEEDAIARELRRQDLPFVHIPAKELPELAEMRTLEAMDVEVDGLHLTCRDGGNVELKWKDVLSVTCVRQEARNEEGGPAPARLILTVFSRKPLASYQLSQNVPTKLPAAGGTPGESAARFRQTGRAIYEKFARSAQNKGMRILASHGFRGKWRGLSFERLEQVQGYNYWAAVLRRYQTMPRGGRRARISIPSLSRIEFEREETPAGPPTGATALPRPAPARRPETPPTLPGVSEWFPHAARYSEIQSFWLRVATLVAAICLAIFIALGLFG